MQQLDADAAQAHTLNCQCKCTQHHMGSAVLLEHTTLVSCIAGQGPSLSLNMKRLHLCLHRLPDDQWLLLIPLCGEGNDVVTATELCKGMTLGVSFQFNTATGSRTVYNACTDKHRCHRLQARW